jgi:hypothetical protein
VGVVVGGVPGGCVPVGASGCATPSSVRASVTAFAFFR